MEIQKEATQAELAKIVKDWATAGDLLANYCITPLTKNEDTPKEHILVPLPEITLERDAYDDLRVDGGIILGGRKDWENVLTLHTKNLDKLAHDISLALSVLAILREEELSDQRNDLAIKFGHLPGYDILPDKSPLRNAIDYIIDNMNKEETK